MAWASRQICKFIHFPWDNKRYFVCFKDSVSLPSWGWFWTRDSVASPFQALANASFLRKERQVVDFPWAQMPTVAGKGDQGGQAGPLPPPGGRGRHRARSEARSRARPRGGGGAARAHPRCRSSARRRRPGGPAGTGRTRRRSRDGPAPAASAPHSSRPPAAPRPPRPGCGNCREEEAHHGDSLRELRESRKAGRKWGRRRPESWILIGPRKRGLTPWRPFFFWAIILYLLWLKSAGLLKVVLELREKVRVRRHVRQLFMFHRSLYGGSTCAFNNFLNFQNIAILLFFWWLQNKNHSKLWKQLMSSKITNRVLCCPR